MRIRLIKLGTSSIIFIFLLIISLLLVRPIYLSVTEKLISIRDDILLNIEKNTALTIKYEKASPSILSGLKLHNIQVLDSQSNLVLLKINSVKFAYNLSALLKGDIEKRFNAYSLAIKSGFMQIDEVRYREDLEPLELDFIKLGLQDVLYNPKTKEIYTPNTNKTTNITNPDITMEGGDNNEDRNTR